MATLQERYTEAEEAYHNLMTGNMPRVVVDQNGERVEFTSTNAPRLLMYVNKLKAEIDALSNPTTSRGPARFIF